MLRAVLMTRLQAEGSVADYEEGQPIIREAMRFATIDCGRDHYGLGIRAFRPDASSVGLYYSRVNLATPVAESPSESPTPSARWRISLQQPP